MSADSAPGPDGFGGHFYHNVWDIIGFEVSEAISSFFINGAFPEGLNASYVVLIPKSVKAVKWKITDPLCWEIFFIKSLLKSWRLGLVLL